MERFQRWHPGCPPHPAGGADHGTHSDLPNDGGRGHYLGSLIQMSLHWFVGHRPLGGAIHRIHMLEHHGIYSGIPALLPWLVIEATLTRVLVAGWRLAVAIGEIVVLVVLFNAVHTQFHLLAPGLERRRWFRTELGRASCRAGVGTAAAGVPLSDVEGS